MVHRSVSVCCVAGDYAPLNGLNVTEKISMAPCAKDDTRSSSRRHVFDWIDSASSFKWIN